MPQRDETILLMEACHVAQVAAIEKACFSEPWSEAAFRSELTNPQALTLVALREGQVAGFVNIAFAADTADINTVAVGTAYRRQGIGKRLLLGMDGGAGFHLLFGGAAEQCPCHRPVPVPGIPAGGGAPPVLSQAG